MTQNLLKIDNLKLLTFELSNVKKLRQLNTPMLGVVHMSNHCVSGVP